MSNLFVGDAFTDPRENIFLFFFFRSPPLKIPVDLSPPALIIPAFLEPHVF